MKTDAGRMMFSIENLLRPACSKEKERRDGGTKHRSSSEFSGTGAEEKTSVPRVGEKRASVSGSDSGYVDLAEDDSLGSEGACCVLMRTSRALQ